MAKESFGQSVAVGQLVIEGNGVAVFAPREEDEEEFVAKVRSSTALHEPWVSPPSSHAGFAAYLERLRQPAYAGFFLRDRSQLVGVVNVNNIVMGALRSGYLGYYAFKGGEGRGLISEGVALVITFAFGELGLHRLEANIQPSNIASLRLAQRVGLVKEGFSERYLYVAGEWRDHERWATTVERHGALKGPAPR